MKQDSLLYVTDDIIFFSFLHYCYITNSKQKNRKYG